jgi:hypothetical protein
MSRTRHEFLCPIPVDKADWLRLIGLQLERLQDCANQCYSASKAIEVHQELLDYLFAFIKDGWAQEE